MLRTTTPVCVLLLSCIVSAYKDDITSIIGQGSRQPHTGQDMPRGYGGGADYGSDLVFDSGAATPVLDPSQASSSVQAGSVDDAAATPVLDPRQASSSIQAGFVDDAAATPVLDRSQASSPIQADSIDDVLGGGKPAPSGGQNSFYDAPNSQGNGGYSASSNSMDYRHGTQNSFYDAPSSQGNGGSTSSFNPIASGHVHGNVDPMQTLLGGMTNSIHQTSNGGGFSPSGRMGYSQSQSGFGAFPNSQVLSQYTTQVVSGLVEAFMHKANLVPHEKTCLERNVGEFTGDVMGTVGNIVIAVKALISGKGTIQRSQQGNMLQAGMDSAMRITSLVTSSTHLAKGCVHGDALAMLKTCEHHLVNAQYLKHRFLVNGVDIAHSLADAIVAFEDKDFRRFGKDIGTSLRKILFSKANHATRLPEGVPEQDIIQEATDGLTRGFFVAGAYIDITDTAQPDVNIHVDLHRCIAGNSRFFKEIFEGLWDLIAQLSANGIEAMGDAFTPNSEHGQPKWAGELMVAMMQFPMALSKCGVNVGQQHMLMEAVKTLGDLKMHFTFPDDHIQTAQPAAQVTDRMAKAVEAWTNWNFERFGFELGKLFRELVMLAFPQKYSIDSYGRLQASIPQEQHLVASSTFVIGGAAASMLVALVIVRTRRSASHQVLEFQRPVIDIEDGDAIECVE